MGKAAERTIRAKTGENLRSVQTGGNELDVYRGRAVIRMKQRQRNRMALREEDDAGMRAAG